MKVRNISGVSHNPFKRLRDEVGSLRKRNQLARLEPYADIIDLVFERYNTDDDSRTMMFKLLRDPVKGTVTRRKHTENCRDIAVEISEGFDWLSTDIIRVMARHHDIGHTFLGHSGEWWLSSIKDTYGMPNYVHNAIGARNLDIKHDVSEEICEKIKAENPNISDKKLAKIKNDLWLIFDAINSHNGERSEYSYAPDFTKTRKRYEEELMGCYTKKGFDRSLIPATAEGSLMRLTDKISYIPYDMVDIFRNGCNLEKATVDGEEHNFYEEYRKAFKALGMPDDSLDRLLACRLEDEYDDFAREIQSILIADVKKNTRRNNIRMSPEVSSVMHSIRDINNKLMVNYTVMKEDHEEYVPTMEKFMESASKFLVSNGFINTENVRASNVTELHSNMEKTQDLLKKHKDDHLTSDFIAFLTSISPRDFEYTVRTCEKAFEETIAGEIDVARAVATGAVDQVEIQAQGHKKERIEQYIEEFNTILDVTYADGAMRKAINPLSNNVLDRFKREIWLDKASKKIKQESMQKLKRGGKGIIPLSEMVGMELGAQFLASRNDYEWRRVFELYAHPTNEVITSLRRGYQEFDFRAEHQKHKTWDNIQKLQARETRLTEEDKKQAGSVLTRLFAFGKKGREREK